MNITFLAAASGVPILLVIVGLIIVAMSVFGALSANLEVDRYVDQELRSFPVKGTTHIYKGGFIGLAAGYARPLVAGDEFVGIAYEEINNTGSDGALSVRVFTQGDFEYTLASSAVASNKGAVYASDDATLTYAAAGNSYVGQQIAVPATNKIVLRLDVGIAPLSTASPAAAGSTQANGTVLAAATNFVTGADGTKGVVLPAAVIGKSIRVVNTAAAILKVYPPSGGTINALSQDAAISMAANTSADFTPQTATQWYTTPRVPS